MKSTGAKMIGLAEAAALARLPYQDAHRALLMGRLRGEKRGGRWFVRLDDAEALARERRGETPVLRQREMVVASDEAAAPRRRVKA